MSIAVTIVIGVAIGAMVEFFLPGHNMSELMLAMLLGVAGALLARYVGQMGDFYGREDPGAYVGASLGAISVLAIYGVLFRRRRT